MGIDVGPCGIGDFPRAPWLAECHVTDVSTVAVGCWETENGGAAASTNDLFRRTLVSMIVSIVPQ